MIAKPIGRRVGATPARLFFRHRYPAFTDRDLLQTAGNARIVRGERFGTRVVLRV
jgi:hypothetical protein